jgi:hypothetical protein
MRWAHENLRTYDYDVELLMIYLQRSMRPEKLPPTETIAQFKFTDVEQKAEWWLIADNGVVEACDKDPGRDIHVYFTTTVKTMTNIWLGKTTYRRARNDNEISIVGNSYLTSNVNSWMDPSPFSADLPTAENIL